jgi:RND family efflux transporter MFP subunit
MLNRLRRLPLIALLFFLAACQQQQTAPPPPPPQVTVSQPLVRQVVEWDDYTGRLEAVEAVEVRARVSGYLQAVHFTDGALVKKGALLFVIDPRPYQAELNRAQAALEQAMAQYERARKDFARAQQLIKMRAISQEEFDTRAADQRQAEEAVQAARAAVEAARLNVEFTQVRAPIGGRISRAYVTAGNLISGGTADATLLTRIVTLDPIYAYFQMDERSYLKYTQLWRNGTRPGYREANIPVSLGLATETAFPHRGRLDFIDNRLDPTTGTMTGRSIFANPDAALMPGLFARLRLPASGPYEALLIPDQAVGTDQTQRFVFVVNDQNTVEYRKVTLGPLIDGLRVIRDGLSPEAWVIVNGVQRARPGLKVEPQRQAIPQEPAPATSETAAAQP